MLPYFLVIAGPSIGLATSTNVVTESFNEPIGSATSASLNLHLSVGDSNITVLLDSSNIIEGENGAGIAAVFEAAVPMNASAESAEPIDVWVKRYDGPANSFDIAYAIAVDDSGNVYVTGYIIGSSLFHVGKLYLSFPAMR